MSTKRSSSAAANHVMMLTRLTNERVGRLIAGQFSSSAGACEHSLSTIRHIGTRSRDLPNTYRTGRLHRCGLLLQTEWRGLPVCLSV